MLMWDLPTLARLHSGQVWLQGQGFSFALLLLMLLRWPPTPSPLQNSRRQNVA